MTHEGACPCGGVRFRVEGPVRNALVCHCGACCETTGGPWAASAAYRSNLEIADEVNLDWSSAARSEHNASRGSCRLCGTVIFWDAPERDTVSFAAAALVAETTPPVTAHIWVGDDAWPGLLDAGMPAFRGGLPATVTVAWAD